MKRAIRVGSRESDLAMAQSKWVVDTIKSTHPELDFEIVGISTSGDVMLDTRLEKMGGKGLFIKELENALINKDIDFAVHSLKDIPVGIHNGLTISAYSKREDPRDVLVTADGKGFYELKKDAVLGTSSIRREVQLLGKRSDLRIKTLRGNVMTRIKKLMNNEYDAIIVAAAGLKRLGLEEKCVHYFSVNEIIPAIGQGILAIESRKGDDISYILDSVHCNESALIAEAEREYMIALNGGCTTPIAAHAVIEENLMKINAMYASEGNNKLYKAYVEGNKGDAVSLGKKLSYIILEKVTKDMEA